MRFDDVITMPFTRTPVLERINRQIGTTFTYYDTAGYFGPDPRGRVKASAPLTENRQGGPYRRMEIVRNLRSGGRLVRDESFSRAPSLSQG